MSLISIQYEGLVLGKQKCESKHRVLHCSTGYYSEVHRFKLTSVYLSLAAFFFFPPGFEEVERSVRLFRLFSPVQKKRPFFSLESLQTCIRKPRFLKSPGETTHTPRGLHVHVCCYMYQLKN